MVLRAGVVIYSAQLQNIAASKSIPTLKRHLRLLQAHAIHAHVSFFFASPTMSLYVHILVGLTIPGVALTATLLIFYAYLAWNPIRETIWTVSAFASSLIFGIVYCMATLNASPNWTCSLISAFMNMSLIFSAGMFLCMAINLPLVLGQKVNGQRMEMYYVSGTSFVSVTATLIPWASGNLGWDAANQSCWYRNSDPETMFRWLLATQTFWIFLACIGEVVAFLAIVGYLITYEFETRYYRRSSVKSSASSPHPGSTILKFRNIVLRIGLYPLVSCLLNISGASLDLHQWKHPEQTDLNIGLNLADLAIYAARPLIYGLLAATDPSFIRALRALQSPLSAYSNQPNGMQWTDACFTTVVDFPSASEDGIDDGRYRRHVQMGDLHRAGEDGSGRRELGEPHKRVDYHRRSQAAEATIPIECSAQKAVMCQI
ncbi:hypothetical protein C8R45DRAFT_1106994 [Mycena sanguinolenta]|nr:hypothetical protein C8R45DRAFT_1106994 [Mycena sanguinolenta]